MRLEDHPRAHRRGPDDGPVPRGEGAGLPALPRTSQAASVRGHPAGEVRRLLALRRGLPSRLHPRGGGREHARKPGLRGRALRGRVRDQPVSLHLLRLLRDRLPVRRDHDGARLRALGLRPLGSDLHQGDAARRATRAHPAQERGRVSAVLFFIAAGGVISGAVGVVVLRDPFYSVLALVAHLISLAVLFLLLRAEFVAAVQVVVYAGAVMVLYVFVVAYVGGESESFSDRLRGPGPVGSGLRLGGAILGGALLIELLIALLGTGLQAIDGSGAPYSPGSQSIGTPAYIGRLLLTRFLLAFEVASFLLLIAAVGAVLLARRRRGRAG